MILTCPNCATRYFLPDEMIGPSGRVVKCTSCDTNWRAMPEGEPFSLVAPAPPEPEPIPASPPQPEAMKNLSADQLSQAFRAKAQTQRKVREAAATGAILAGLAAGVAVLMVLLAVFRASVVRVWPKTASAYSAVGLAVNTTGLVIEQVQAAPAPDPSHPAVVVAGVIRNVVDRTVAAPPLRVSLLAKGGRTVARQLAPVGDPPLKPGETRRFTVSFADPPPLASDVEVTFSMEAAASMAAAARHAPAPKLRGPAPIDQGQLPAPPIADITGATDAKPLPPGSRYALPNTAKPNDP